MKGNDNIIWVVAYEGFLKQKMTPTVYPIIVNFQNCLVPLYYSTYFVIEMKHPYQSKAIKSSTANTLAKRPHVGLIPMNK